MCCSHFPLLCEEMSSYLGLCCAVIQRVKVRRHLSTAAAVTRHLNYSRIVYVYEGPCFKHVLRRFSIINTKI